MKLFIPIKPVPKQRPRVGRSRVYTPKETVQFERAVQIFLKYNFKYQIFSEPLMVNIIFYLERKKSVIRSRPSVKPDLDNLIKSLTDACNKIIWEDDAQIVTLTASKFYATAEFPVGIVLYVDKTT